MEGRLPRLLFVRRGIIVEAHTVMMEEGNVNISSHRERDVAVRRACNVV
jgi:hypothetical protein